MHLHTQLYLTSLLPRLSQAPTSPNKSGTSTLEWPWSTEMPTKALILMLDCNTRLSEMNPAHEKGMLPAYKNYTFKKSHTKSGVMFSLTAWATEPTSFWDFASPSSGPAWIPHIWVANGAGWLPLQEKQTCAGRGRDFPLEANPQICLELVSLWLTSPQDLIGLLTSVVTHYI